MPFPPTKSTISRALAEKNYEEPTPVQSAVLAPETAGRDLLVSAQTGSGKTVAYGLGLVDTLMDAEADTFSQPGAPLALVVAPTRELALQVQRELEWLYRYTEARIVACVGGMDPRSETRRLATGATIVVGTPGRLRDHLERGNLDVSTLRALVLDEADEMLDMGFREDLEFILQSTPPERRTLMFSATMPKTISAMARRYQREALRLEVATGERGHADIDYRAVRVAPHDVEHAVVNLLRFYDSPSTIVFCNTRDAVRHLGATLTERGFAAVLLSGELSQHERNSALQSLRDGRARVCVATDVAARGIDLPSLNLVIHADLPNDPEVLQHRSGRTGRAGRKGTSILLVPMSRRRRAESLLAAARIRFEWDGPPSAESIRKLDAERLVSDPMMLEEGTEEDLVLAKSLLSERSPEQIASALVRLYRSRLPSPEDVYDPGPMRDVRAPRDKTERAPRPEPSPRFKTDRPVRQNDGAPSSPSSGPRNGKSIWFRMDIGRRNEADPRWLLPMICRRGKITKADIGAIRIFDKETKFEVAEGAADRLIAATKNNEGEEIRIELLGPDGAPSGKPPSRDGHRAHAAPNRTIDPGGERPRKARPPRD
ncbi:DEAD/DEAH box helicase [Lichenihabitans sp. PAMC28606]|uniref:DEAD/DEAH box helicase n=1 Tax=Lichenihabitans sp. PAMC28606 TaxID=2880932 RepID=UPI001D0B8364|nr:DEAD/DEAH box helicase [Lichenihabitans sp. PAMC28606]UDL94302.1 DEAD/DEAH box helicase [Lichenihabitans sp. PAMC28606]